MASKTRLSTKGQVVIPKAVRDEVAYRPGDELTVEARGQEVVLRKAPRSWVDWGYGLGQDIWKDVDVDAYLRKLRREWDRK